MKNMIENARLDSATKAIKATFNGEIPIEISELTGGGSSAKMFKFQINNHDYVLRVMGLDQPIEDRNIQIECANYGSKLTIAPHCYYANAKDGIIIMDYVDQVKLTKDTILQQLPRLLSKLHYSEKISPPFCVVFPYMNDLIANALKVTPSKLITDYYRTIQTLMPLLSKHAQFASCHNDLNSENILFDGKKIFLIDFEAAGLEDPYFDLAAVAVQFCFDEMQERKFLENYLARMPNQIEISKLILMKQIAYCYYALHFFQHAYNANLKTFEGNIPSYQQWYDGKMAGKYSYATANDWMLYAMVVVNQSMEEMNNPRFNKAKRILENAKGNI